MSKISEQIIDKTASSLFELTWSILSGLGKKATDKIKAKKALEKYYLTYFRRNGSIKVLGMAEPMPLDQIYTRVRLTHAYRGLSEKDLDEHEENFRSMRSFHFQEASLDAFDVANSYEKLNVLGAPGSGKSTLLKKIGLTLLIEDKRLNAPKFVHDCIPVFIELKKFRDGEVDLKQHIQSEFEIAEFPESPGFVESALKNGKLLLLLDGLDEVPNANLEKVIQQIKDFTDKYPLNRFITSCRTAFYKNYLNDYTDIQVASFDDDQIRSFIKNWFGQERDIASGTHKRFSSLLFDSKNIQTLELARTPLLLTFLCLTYDDGQNFPANRSSLYRRAMQILLEKWSAEKRIHNEEVYKGLNSDIEIEMLAKIAAHFYDKDKTFFYSDELKELIKLFLKDTLDLQLPPVSKILEAIEIQQGLLVERAPDIYSFSHLTIQEYLTAHFYQSPKRLPQLIRKHIFDDKWREVFLLQAGMANSDDLLLMLMEYLKEYSQQHEVLRNAIEWVNKIVKTGDDTFGASKRVFFLDFLLRFKRDRDKEMGGVGVAQAYRPSYSKNIGQLLSDEFSQEYELPQNIGRQSAPKIFDVLSQLLSGNRKFISERKQVQGLIPPAPISKLPPGSRYYFNRQILTIIYGALNLPENLQNMRTKQHEPIKNYLQGLALIVECRNASLRTSRETWETVFKGFVR